jgi:hypothetical protein
MRQIQRLFATILLTFCCAPAFAQGLYNGNPYCKIAFVGPASIFFSNPAEVLTDGFAVQLTDPGGMPLQGLQVEFDVNTPINFPGLPPDPTPPATFGRLNNSTGPSGHFVLVITDALGIARSGPFTAGTISGTYGVSANVYISFYPENIVCKVVPGPSASFAVTQDFSPSTIPTLSSTMLFGLLVLLALIAAHRHRSR